MLPSSSSWLRIFGFAAICVASHPKPNPKEPAKPPDKPSRAVPATPPTEGRSEGESAFDEWVVGELSEDQNAVAEKMWKGISSASSFCLLLLLLTRHTISFFLLCRNILFMRFYLLWVWDIDNLFFHSNLYLNFDVEQTRCCLREIFLVIHWNGIHWWSFSGTLFCYSLNQRNWDSSADSDTFDLIMWKIRVSKCWWSWKQECRIWAAIQGGWLETVRKWSTIYAVNNICTGMA